MPSGAGEGGSPQIEAVFWDIGFLARRRVRVDVVSVYVIYVSYVLYVCRADVRRGGRSRAGGRQKAERGLAESGRRGGAAANLAGGEARPQALLDSCGWDRNGSAGPPSRLRLLRCLRSLRVVSSCILPIPFSYAGLRIGGAARCVGDAEHGYVPYVSYVAARFGISAAGRSARITRRRRSQLDSARNAKAAPRRGSPSPVGRGSPANRGARAGSTSPRGRPSSKRLVLVMPVGCSHVSPCKTGTGSPLPATSPTSPTFATSSNEQHLAETVFTLLPAAAPLMGIAVASDCRLCSLRPLRSLRP